MGFFGWILFGALSGWLASIFVKQDRGGCIYYIFLGIVGSFVGGFVMSLFGAPGVTGFNLRSIFVAMLGAWILIYLVRQISGKR